MNKEKIPSDNNIGSYHNHTTWSDGSLEPEELIKIAIDLHFNSVGITDHYFTNKGVTRSVVDEQIDDYVGMIKSLANKYKQKIRILSGLEIDTSKSNPNRYKLPFDKLNKLDYLLFEYVGEDENTFTLEKLIEIRKNITCRVGLAHPDLKWLLTKYKADKLATMLGKNDIFIDACGSERNSRPDPYRRGKVIRTFTLNIEGLGEEFKKMAKKHNVKFLPSSDTHENDSHDWMADANKAAETIKEYGYKLEKFKNDFEINEDGYLV